MNGFPKLQHCWCMRHFVANMWKRCPSKEAMKRLKALCNSMEKTDFENKKIELEKILNEPEKVWLAKQMADKHKWALTYDIGGWRYGIMTTNISEVFNFVLKGIRAMPVSTIVEYTFRKCNAYFVDRWKLARGGLAAGEV